MLYCMNGNEDMQEANHQGLYDEKLEVHRLPEDPEQAEVEFEEHNQGMRNYMRDIVLGVNDGLVSIYLLVAGIVGGAENARSITSETILLAGLVATIAGAISMMAGEYISTKSQEEVYDADIEQEKIHLKYFKNHEINELYDYFGDLGLKGNLLEQVVQTIASDDEAMMKTMLAMEFGILDVTRRSPMKAMLTVALLFIAGALPSIIPFMFIDNPVIALYWATGLASLALFGTGAMKTLMTKTNPIKAGFEHLIIGLIGGGVSFALGFAFGVTVA